MAGQEPIELAKNLLEFRLPIETRPGGASLQRLNHRVFPSVTCVKPGLAIGATPDMFPDNLGGSLIETTE
jgi:hypothetical protein